jgi:sulfide:quinone oxidoreductase
MLALHHLGDGALALTVVAPRTFFEYRPLAVTEPFENRPVPRFDLEALASSRNARHVRDAIASVDTDARSVELGAGGRLEYDFLVVAVGARAVVGVPGATPFWAGAGVDQVRTLAAGLESGAVRDAIVAVPGGVSWPLPAYELALQAARRRTAARADGRIVLVTPERAPLEVFGRRIASAVGDLLDECGVEVVTGSTPERFTGEELHLRGGEVLRADHVVALPRLYGPGMSGLPHDAEGFIRTDAAARVEGVERVWAAGDASTCPLKQGGVGSHHADVAAQSIALAAGVPADATALRPVLRAVMFTGAAPFYMRRLLDDPADPHGDRAAVARHPFWWPPDKIAGRYLAPFLAGAEPLAQPAARAG